MKLYALRSTSPLSRALFKVPVFLVSVSRSGRTSRWSPDPARAQTFTKEQRERLVKRYEHVVTGRWVLAPAVQKAAP